MTGGAHTVRVLYAVPLADGGPFVEALHRLPADEQARAARYRHESSRRQFVTARTLLRTGLAARLAVGPGEFGFRLNPFGRPELADPHAASMIRFNLSHTDGLVMCALADGVDVGVDAEAVRAPPTKIVGRFFAPAERRAIAAEPAAHQAAAFFRYWTLKEAYIKARGEGLAIPLDSFAIAQGPDGAVGLDVDAARDPRAGAWSLRALTPTATHQAAICVDTGGRPLKIHADRVDVGRLAADGLLA